MIGSLVQQIALVTYGNAFLAGRDIGDFYPKHSAFVFHKEVKFVDLVQKDKGMKEMVPYATDPNEWLIKLKKEGYKQLRLQYISSGVDAGGNKINDRNLVAFVGGGGTRLIEAMKDDASTADLWQGRESLGDKNDLDRKIWHTTYGRIAKDTARPASPEISIDEMKNKLSRVLQEIGLFALEKKLTNFADIFGKALQILTGNGELPKSDLVPPNYLSGEALRLLTSCDATWVFGGMGSWNDFWFDGDDQKRYEDVSDRLYSLINQSIMAAVNSVGAVISDPYIYYFDKGMLFRTSYGVLDAMVKGKGWLGWRYDAVGDSLDASHRVTTDEAKKITEKLGEEF